MLEDFVRLLVPAGDTLMPYAEQCLDGIPPEGRLFSEAHRAKALIHTWLAWQKQPGSPLGLAITQRALDADAELALRFVAWCRRLFIDLPLVP